MDVMLITSICVIQQIKKGFPSSFSTIDSITINPDQSTQGTESGSAQ